MTNVSCETENAHSFGAYHILFVAYKSFIEFSCCLICVALFAVLLTFFFAFVPILRRNFILISFTIKCMLHKEDHYFDYMLQLVFKSHLTNNKFEGASTADLVVRIACTVLEFCHPSEARL